MGRPSAARRAVLIFVADAPQARPRPASQPGPAPAATLGCLGAVGPASALPRSATMTKPRRSRRRGPPQHGHGHGHVSPASPCRARAPSASPAPPSLAAAHRDAGTTGWRRPAPGRGGRRVAAFVAGLDAASGPASRRDAFDMFSSELCARPDWVPRRRRRRRRG